MLSSLKSIIFKDLSPRLLACASLLVLLYRSWKSMSSREVVREFMLDLPPPIECVQIINEFEGCSLVSYKDKKGRWAIGWGCTDGVGPNQTVTQEQADLMRDRKINEVASQVEDLLKHPLNANQLSAVTCFAYNEGVGHFMVSTMLKLINKGDLEAASNEFPKWVYEETPNGKVVSSGLVRRRAAEQALFLAPVTNVADNVSSP